MFSDGVCVDRHRRGRRCPASVSVLSAVAVFSRSRRRRRSIDVGLRHGVRRRVGPRLANIRARRPRPVVPDTSSAPRRRSRHRHAGQRRVAGVRNRDRVIDHVAGAIDRQNIGRLGDVQRRGLVDRHRRGRRCPASVSVLSAVAVFSQAVAAAVASIRPASRCAAPCRSRSRQPRARRPPIGVSPHQARRRRPRSDRSPSRRSASCCRCSQP